MRYTCKIILLYAITFQTIFLYKLQWFCVLKKYATDCRGNWWGCFFSYSCSHGGQFYCFHPWHIQMLLKFKLDFTGFRWLSKECKWVNSRLHLMLFALLLLKKELRVFMLYVSFNHMTIFFVPHFVEYWHLLGPPIVLFCCLNSNLSGWSVSHTCFFCLKGYGSFLLRDLPFDAIQFCIYEQLRIGYRLAVLVYV